MSKSILNLKYFFRLKELPQLIKQTSLYCLSNKKRNQIGAQKGHALHQNRNYNNYER